MLELEDIIFSDEINLLLSELSKFDQSSLKFYIKGGFPRDTYLDILPNDVDIVVIIKSDDPDIEMALVHVLKEKFNAFQNPYDKNIYTTKSIVSADITIARADYKKPDAKCNGFIIIPSPIPGNSTYQGDENYQAFKGVFGFPVKYFKDSKHASEYLEKSILETPGSPDEDFLEDPVRMLRFCRFTTSKPLKIGTEEKKAMAHLNKELSIRKIVADTHLFGRVYSELNKIEPHQQADYLAVLNSRNLLCQLFAGNFHDTQQATYPFNLKNLNYFINNFHLRDLFQLHCVGFGFKKNRNGLYILWSKNQTLFFSKPKNSLILMQFCLSYGIQFPLELIKKIFAQGKFSSAFIKDSWGDLTRSLRTLLLNENALANFKLLRDSGIFGFLFPKANAIIDKSKYHEDYIHEILTNTQSASRPSISFIYRHFLALEVAKYCRQTRRND